MSCCVSSSTNHDGRTVTPKSLFKHVFKVAYELKLQIAFFHFENAYFYLLHGFKGNYFDIILLQILLSPH